MDKLYADPDRIRIFPITEESCPECGAVHDAKMPHYRGSIYYQMCFQQKHGRMPTWKDAMAHCAKPVQEEAIRYLRKKGVPETEITGKEGKQHGQVRNLPKNKKNVRK